MNLHRRSFLATLGTVASSFFILPSATTYERVWKSIAQTPMLEEAMLRDPSHQFFKNIGTANVFIQDEVGNTQFILEPGQGLHLVSGIAWHAKSMGCITPVHECGEGVAEVIRDGEDGAKLLVLSVLSVM